MQRLCVHTQKQITPKIFLSYLNKTPLRYAHIYIPGDINRRDVSVYVLEAYGEVGIEIHAFLISARHANKWRASSLSLFAPDFHGKEGAWTPGRSFHFGEYQVPYPCPELQYESSIFQSLT